MNFLNSANAENIKPENSCKLIFENSPDGFAYCQMIFENNNPSDFIYLAINPAFEKLASLKNVIGRRVTEIVPDI
jgi:PAS domain-containing protein